MLAKQKMLLFFFALLIEKHFEVSGTNREASWKRKNTFFVGPGAGQSRKRNLRTFGAPCERMENERRGRSSSLEISKVNLSIAHN